MPWKAVRAIDVGTGSPVEAGEIIPAKVAEGIGLPDDPAHRSSWIDSGYLRWTDESAPRAQKSTAKKSGTKKSTAKRSTAKRSSSRRKGSNVPDEKGEPTVDEQDPAQPDSAAGGNHEGTSVGADTAAKQVERPDSEKAIAQRGKAAKKRS